MTTKKIITTLFSFLIMLSVFTLASCENNDKIIGEVYGSEHEYIRIGEDTYTVCENPGVTKSEHNKKLGKVEFKDKSIDPIIVWSIDGFDEYIYTLWVYDGAYYKKDDKYWRDRQ
ncbi:MAG: hypothetical protein NC293_02010 [Roseburia sp.]|nr:hypothetical protein [Roseburia sp.]